MPAISQRSAWAVDIALWLAPAAVFVAVYTSEPQVPAASAPAHLAVALLLWSALAVLRMVIAMLVPSPRAARAVSALALAAAFTIVVAYYILVIWGLRSWGRVVSGDLIRTYAGQAAALAQVLGLSVIAVGLAIAGAIAAAYALVWRYLGRCDWVADLARNASSVRYIGTVIALAAVGAGGLGILRTGWAVATAEPVSLTFYPETAAKHFQGHGIDRLRAGQLDAAEDAARAAYAVNAHADRKNVVLIVVDALRADHLGVYGYARDTTPHLSSLARAGSLRVVPELRSSCSSSACGMVSLLASKFVHEFSARPITLQEVLKRHGYRVHMALGGNHREFYGLAEMYGEVDSFYDTAGKTVAYMNDDQPVLERVRAMPAWDGTPVMIQLHLMSAHPLGVRDARHVRYSPAVNYVIMGARTPQLAANYYDNGVAQVDAVIRELLAMLRAKGYLANTLVAITADHGEALGENGRYSHARGLDEAAIRIPLLLIAEGYRPPPLKLDPTDIASQVDVAPTILHELHMKRPATWSGLPLQQPYARDFLYLQELDAVGLIDQRDRRNVWKYWIEGEQERAVNLSVAPHAEALDAVPPELKRDWRRRYLSLVASATLVPREK